LVATVISDPKKKRPPVKQTAEPHAAEKGVEGDSVARVDRWFDQQLTSLYGEVAEEPVPSEILELVNKLKSPH